VAEGARLESVYTATYRGFESLPHRHLNEENPANYAGFSAFWRPVASAQGYRPFTSRGAVRLKKAKFTPHRHIK
jgi:hypothetical protein